MQSFPSATLSLMHRQELAWYAVVSAPLVWSRSSGDSCVCFFAARRDEQRNEELSKRHTVEEPFVCSLEDVHPPNPPLIT